MEIFWFIQPSALDHHLMYDSLWNIISPICQLLLQIATSMKVTCRREANYFDATANESIDLFETSLISSYPNLQCSSSLSWILNIPFIFIWIGNYLLQDIVITNAPTMLHLFIQIVPSDMVIFAFCFYRYGKESLEKAKISLMRCSLVHWLISVFQNLDSFYPDAIA